jgi:hypothetical protein
MQGNGACTKKGRAVFVAHGEGTPDRRHFSATSITSRLGSSHRHQHAQCTRSRGISVVHLVALLRPLGPSRAISPSVAIPTGTRAPRAISHTTTSTVDGISMDCLSMCGITTPSHGRSRRAHASHPLSGGVEDDLRSSLHREQTFLGRFAEQPAAGISFGSLSAPPAPTSRYRKAYSTWRARKPRKIGSTGPSG